MATEWKWIIYIFFNKDSVMEDLMDDVTRVIATYSGESLEDEERMWDAPLKFSPTGVEPANVYGISFPAKKEMKDEIIKLLSPYPKLRYVLLSNTDIGGYDDRELITTNLTITPIGQKVEYDNVKEFMYDEFGLKEILPPDEEEEIVEEPTIIDRIRGFLGI